MDLRTVVIISTLLLVTAGLNETSSPVTPVTTRTNGTTAACPCTNAAPATAAGPNSNPSSPSPTLGLLTITWLNKCVGEVNLILYHPSNSSSPVCHGSETHIQSVLRNVCENKKGCKGTPRWGKGNGLKGYDITASGAEESPWCDTLRVHCTVVEALPDEDLQGQLQAFKVITGLLCCVLLVVLLLRFTRPTVKALQQRLSERRQNRWVGPTQSHSVSYHRGKTTVKNNDEEKRLSYPALERLAVIDSREPSSNRNSDYNF